MDDGCLLILRLTASDGWREEGSYRVERASVYGLYTA
jgi:hypothetical protein